MRETPRLDLQDFGQYLVKIERNQFFYPVMYKNSNFLLDFSNYSVSCNKA